MGEPHPRPAKRVRGRLPTIAELGGRCQVCGYQGQFLDRMHLLRGVWKEDLPELIMVGCNAFGRCKVHELHTRGTEQSRRDASMRIRSVMREDQEQAIIERRGHDYLERAYPSFSMRAAGT